MSSSTQKPLLKYCDGILGSNHALETFNKLELEIIQSLQVVSRKWSLSDNSFSNYPTGSFLQHFVNFSTHLTPCSASYAINTWSISHLNSAPNIFFDLKQIGSKGAFAFCGITGGSAQSICWIVCVSQCVRFCGFQNVERRSSLPNYWAKFCGGEK